MTEDVAAVFRPVADDLASAGHSVRLDPDPSETHDGRQRAQLILDGEVLGSLVVDPTRGMNTALLLLADLTQDFLVGRRQRQDDGTPWPACVAGHLHPMRIVYGLDDPVWTCPRDPRINVPIGKHPGRPFDLP
ncbi:hypothetical protein [Gandjariella thermophila]|uniref:hypothetical protein n=1 Tax=Gandjariella thermophila TaxID=1931992 RepID=UPI0010F80528|nr:hypothetical protein [Gandjariella thermophila]